MFRNIQDRFQEEGFRLKNELLLKEKQGAVQEVTRNGGTIPSMESLLHAEISDIEDKIRSSNVKVEGYLRRERNLEGELKVYQDRAVIEKFGGSAD